MRVFQPPKARFGLLWPLKTPTMDSGAHVRPFAAPVPRPRALSRQKPAALFTAGGQGGFCIGKLSHGVCFAQTKIAHIFPQKPYPNLKTVSHLALYPKKRGKRYTTSKYKLSHMG